MSKATPVPTKRPYDEPWSMDISLTCYSCNDTWEELITMGTLNKSIYTCPSCDKRNEVG